MAKTIRSPFGTVIIDKDHHHVFESLFGEHERKTHRHQDDVSMTPEVDIYEDHEKFTLYMDLPGIDKSSIQVAVSGSNLTVNAHTQKLNLTGGHWIRHERRVGTYVRNLHLGHAVNPDNIKASYADGTLKLILTKKDQGEAKKIDVMLE